MNWNWPNTLTVGRIVFIPFFVLLFYIQPLLSQYQINLLATVIFVLASITDWLDGYLARRLQQTSNFGAFLDPVADKLMVTVALILLVELDRVGAVIAFIIIGREIAISALREWMAGLGKSSSVAVAMVGKLKTIAQMIAIPFLLYDMPLLGINIHLVGHVLILIAAFLTLLSMAYYLKAALPTLRGH
jgi:CDP-diacylglycerol--glycerol-3-phosphate 3-phosphatidyltransferase